MRIAIVSSIFCFTFVSACGSPSRDRVDASGIDPSPLDLPPLDVPTSPASTSEPSIEPQDLPLVISQEELDRRSEGSAPEPTSWWDDPLLPTELDDLAIPETRSAAPTEKEWAEQKSHLRTTTPACRARVVREWIAITCETGPVDNQPVGVVRVLSGDARDVMPSAWIPKASDGYGYSFAQSYISAVFPVRRGDRRIMELAYVGRALEHKFDHILAFTVSEVWLEGMKSPEISVTR